MVWALLIGASLSSCSPTKYSYYFDHQTYRSGNAARTQAAAADATPASPEGVAVSASATPADVQVTVPTAARQVELGQEAGEGASVNSPVPAATKKRVDATATKKSERASRKQAADDASEGGDPKKNGWAIAGFISVLAGWFLAWPLVIVGVIFSAMGLKSQQRGLAIAGFVLGIIGLVIVLAAGANGKL